MAICHAFRARSRRSRWKRVRPTLTKPAKGRMEHSRRRRRTGCPPCPEIHQSHKRVIASARDPAEGAAGGLFMQTSQNRHGALLRAKSSVFEIPVPTCTTPGRGTKKQCSDFPSGSLSGQISKVLAHHSKPQACASRPQEPIQMKNAVTTVTLL